MNILVTGTGGYLGSHLVPHLAREHKVYGLHRKIAAEKIAQSADLPLKGDILLPNLGLGEVPQLDAVYHLAALLDFRKDKQVWRVNFEGTKNVIQFCKVNNIHRIFYCSTAYTAGRNAYEKSKAEAEQAVLESGLRATIFRPSILVGERPEHKGFYQFIQLMVRTHHRAEVARRRVEGSLRLPILEPAFRIQGDPLCRLNLVPVTIVAKVMSRIDMEGIYWLTNPSPPTLEQLARWVGDVLMLRISFEPHFPMNPIEAVFHRMASPFLPYLSDTSHFPTCLSRGASVGRTFIQRSVEELFR